MEDGGGEVFGGDGVSGGVGGPAVGCAVDEAALDAAAGEGGGVAAGPVFAAGVGGGDSGVAAEFADPDDQGFVEHAAAVEVVEECGEAEVGGGHEAVLELVEVIAVGVPEVDAVVVPVDGDEWDAGLDQATGEEEALAVDVAAVAVAQAGVFAVDVEGASGLGRGEGVDGAGLEAVPGGWGWLRGGFERDAAEEVAAAGEPIDIDAFGEVEAGDLEGGSVGVADDDEGVERLAEPAAVLAGGPASGRGGMRDDPGEDDGGREVPRGGMRRATNEPRWGQSAAEGPSASELGRGARWPVWRRWTVERWAGSSWVMERTSARRCIC